MIDLNAWISIGVTIKEIYPSLIGVGVIYKFEKVFLCLTFDFFDRVKRVNIKKVFAIAEGFFYLLHRSF